MMTSPLSNSETSAGFDRLCEPVRRWIWRKQWRSLRDIQERSIHTLLDGDGDAIIAAPTAGGKTEAAFLPLISSVLENPGAGGFDLVYIGALRALINDQFERLEILCKACELPVYPWHGDISRTIKTRARKNPRGILLITPEALEALFVLRGLEIPTLFTGTSAIIIDELHALLDNERGIHLRSLLTRIELATGRRIRRVGLSATLGEMTLAREYLRPDNPDSVTLLESVSEGSELRAQILGFLENRNEEDEPAKRAVAKHLFSRLRGSNNLIFAGTRQNVEVYANALREVSEKERLPLEFLPHHANLSREHRLNLEERLKSGTAVTAVCTSTLELGIDIGDISCVAQIGPPFSVASLRQRLGRSGRRAGQAAILRMYAIEAAPGADSHPITRLHLDLVRSIAMLELLVGGWCEPPARQALHLSTLTHQILSVIAQHDGAHAKPLYTTLCEKGPFQKVSASLFARLLHQLGDPGVELIEQAADGLLLLGRKGERIVNNYKFYAVFQTPEEYRIVADGKSLGTLPVLMVIVPDMTIIFSGRRWRITAVSDKDKVIEVTRDTTGRPPVFGGGGGQIHDKITAKMRDVLAGDDLFAYLDKTAAAILADSRSEFRRLGLGQHFVLEISDRRCLIAIWTGTIKTSTLALALRSMGYTVEVHTGFLDVNRKGDLQDVKIALEEIANRGAPAAAELLGGGGNLMTEKFHPYLGAELLLEDAASSRIDPTVLPALARKILRGECGL